MKVFNSLQARLAMAAGISVTLLWLAASAITAYLVGNEMEEVFDDGLKATAQRILPIAQHDLREGLWRRDSGERDDDGDEYEGNHRDEKEDKEARYGEGVSFVVRDTQNEVIFGSNDVDPAIFPPFEKKGFLRTETHQIYYEAATSGGVTIAVAESLHQRDELWQKMLLGLLLPVLLIIPISLLAIVVGVRLSLHPIREFREGLLQRGAQDLSPLPDNNLPRELKPISAAVNQLLERLKAAFDAERAFAANAAHELRTPVAGAIAQAQRIKSETAEDRTSQRAMEIETTLKRLMRMSEKLMQLARAEGGRLRTDAASDLRPVLQIIVDDFARVGETRIDLKLSDQPVNSKMDPDAFGILCRNLIENALKHGAQDKPVAVTLQQDGVLCVANDGPALPADAMSRLLRRFERGDGKIAGNGLGLAIVKAIADRVEATVTVASPRQGMRDGVEVKLGLPLA